MHPTHHGNYAREAKKPLYNSTNRDKQSLKDSTLGSQWGNILHQTSPLLLIFPSWSSRGISKHAIKTWAWEEKFIPAVDAGKKEVLVLQCTGIFSSRPSVVQRESPHFLFFPNHHWGLSHFFTFFLSDAPACLPNTTLFSQIVWIWVIKKK